MANTVMIGDREVPVFDDDTPEGDLFAPVIDGEPMGKGQRPRNWDEFPQSFMDPPSEIESMTLDELAQRCVDNVEQKATNAELRWHYGEKGHDVSTYDQNGHGYCTTEDTEVLTDKGWTLWPDWDGLGRLGTMNPITGNLEFQRPLARQAFDYSGEVIYSSNRRIDFGVTPNHRMLVRQWDQRRKTLSDSFTFTMAKDIGWYCGLPHATRGWAGTDLRWLAVDADREYAGDDLMALLGIIVSDGWAGGTDKTRNWVSFVCFRDDQRSRVAAMAGRNGFRESPSKPGVFVRYDAGALARWIRANCYDSDELGSRHKRVPELVKCATPRQIEIFLDYFNDRSRDSVHFYTVSKGLADDLQELLLRCGKRTTISRVPPRSSMFNGKLINGGPAFDLYVSQTDRLCLDRKKHIETDRYKGQVFCATVPNGTLVTRRNGSMLVSGNCWAYSVHRAAWYANLRAGQPFVRHDPHVVAVDIKKGRDEGGWCGLSLKYIRENGMAIEGSWPRHSRSMSNFTPALREAMKKHRVVEDWYDVTRREYDQEMTFLQVLTRLALLDALALDFNWWGHSVCGVDAVFLGSLSRPITLDDFGILIDNSWTDQWGDRGQQVLRGSKARPDGAVGVRQVLAR